MEKFIVVGGCFWCVESDFELVDGVKIVVFGYIGGIFVNLIYKDVSKKGLGYYEVVEICFDNNKVICDEFFYKFFCFVDLIDVGG